MTIEATENVAGDPFDTTEPASGVVEIAKPMRGVVESLARVSAIVGAGDAEDLRWFFRSGGFDTMTQSPLAGMLARAELYGVHARPCERCGGDRKLWNGGSGFISSKTGWAVRQPTAEEKAKIALLFERHEIPTLIGDKVCTTCEGHGWHVPPNCRAMFTGVNGEVIKLKANQAYHPPMEPDVTDLARLGSVTKKLAAVRRHQGGVPATGALEAYYSPDGGSIAALWHLVPAGKKMLKTNPQRLPPTQFFANEREAQSTNPKPNRRALFDAAEDQSRQLFEYSCRLWNEHRGARK